MNAYPNQSSRNFWLPIAVCLALANFTASAVDRTWSGATASYTNTTWTGGIVPVAADNAINNNGSNNVVLINATDPNWTVNDIRAGNAASTSGSFLQNGATVTLQGGWFRMGVAAGAVGFYTLSNGTVNVTATSSQFTIGEAAGAFATLNVAGGTVNKSGGSVFWVGKAGSGVVNLSGTGSIISANNIEIGDRGSGTGSVGTFNQSGGTNTCAGEIWIGNGTGGTGTAGTYNLSSNGVLNANSWLAVGRNSATGVLNISGNAILKKGGAGNHITLAGIGTAQSGTINQTGGYVTNEANQTWIGETGIGIYNMSGGVASLGIVHIGQTATPTGTLNLNGGTMGVTEITSLGGNSTMNFNGGTLFARASNTNFLRGLLFANVQAGGVILDSQNFDVTIAQNLVDVGGGSLTKLGSGALYLTGANTYAGGTRVNGGRLVVTTTAAVAGGSYTVTNGSSFGVRVPSLNAQASLASLTLHAPTATLEFDLGNFGNPTVAPITLTGALSVNGTVSVNIADTLPAIGEVPLVQYTTTNGAGSFVLGTLPIGVQGYLTNSTVTYPSTLVLVITSAGSPRWNGILPDLATINGNWDVDVTTNWIEQSTLGFTKFRTGTPALFDDNAVGTTTVSIVSNVNPGAVSFANSSLPYTLTGPNKISGGSTFTKSGTGVLTNYANNNDYTGPTLLFGGTVSVTNLANGGLASPLGASSANSSNLILANATLNYSGPALTINRGYTVRTTNSSLDLSGALTLSGQAAADVGGGFVKRGVGQLTYTGSVTNQIGNGAFPAYQIAAGTVMFDGSAGGQVITNNGELWVGGTTTSGASLIVSNTALAMNNWLAVGRGNGSIGNVCTVDVFNSTVAVANISLGYDGGLAGNLNTQVMNVNNSTVANAGNFFIGESGGSTTTVSFNNSASTCTTLDVGMNGTAVATLNLNNSSNTCASLFVGLNGTSVGTVNVTNSTILCATLVVATNSTSTGTVNQASGYVGRSAGGGDWRIAGNGGGVLAVGTYNFSGGTFEPNGNFQIGSGGLGTWNQTGGTMNENSGFPVVGRYVGSTGVANISGGSFNQNGAGQLLIIGEQGTGTMTISSSATVNCAGGVSLSHTLTGTGTLNLNGGTLTTRIFQSPGNGVGGSGTLNLNGGLLVASTNAALNFMSNLTSANVLAGGANVDSGTNVIGIVQPLLNSGGNGGLTKLGAGTLYLNGANTYTGLTTVSNGTLGGIGSITGPVLVTAAGTLAPGASIGTLTINSNLTINGNLAIEVNTTLAPQSNDVTIVTGTLINTGTGFVTLTNLGTNALLVGDTFTLFNQPIVGGAALTVVGGGVNWTNNLAFNGSITVIAPPPTVSTNPVTLTNVFGGGNLNLTWPTDHVGWRLEVQTNTRALGLSTNWFTWPDAATTNAVTIPVNVTGPTVFFRLVYP